MPILYCRYVVSGNSVATDNFEAQVSKTGVRYGLCDLNDQVTDTRHRPTIKRSSFLRNGAVPVYPYGLGQVVG